MKKLKSRRSDGRGHWPAGKRRNADAGNWGRIRLALRRLIESLSRSDQLRFAASYRALAAALGVSDRAVRNWVAGVDRPTPLTQAAVEQWLIDLRERLRPGGTRD